MARFKIGDKVRTLVHYEREHLCSNRRDDIPKGSIGTVLGARDDGALLKFKGKMQPQAFLNHELENTNE